MAQIHIGRGTTHLGAFTEAEVREGLQTGQFLPTDLGWITGMENWKALAEFPELTATPVTDPVYPGLDEAPLPRLGLPWDERDSLGFIQAFVTTIKLILMEPGKAFSQMQRGGGIEGPLLFAIVSGWIGGAAVLFYNFIYQTLTQSVDKTPLPAALPSFLAGGTMTIGLFVFTLIFFPIFLALGIFVSAGITHLSLLLLGGAKQSFETTLRVVCFSIGSTALFQLLPICGSSIYLIWNLVGQCIGIAKAHEISTGKAVAAVLLPLVLCCCAMVGLIAFGAAAAARMH